MQLFGRISQETFLSVSLQSVAKRVFFSVSEKGLQLFLFDLSENVTVVFQVLQCIKSNDNESYDDSDTNEKRSLSFCSNLNPIKPSSPLLLLLLPPSLL